MYLGLDEQLQDQFLSNCDEEIAFRLIEEVKRADKSQNYVQLK